MLVVIFSVSDARYAIACQRVVEVIPLVLLRPVPGAPKWVSGSFVYRGALTPVVDLSQLLGARSSPPWLSSRIIVTDCARADGRPIRAGLLATHMTEARHIDVSPLPGGNLDSEPYLGEVVLEGGDPLTMLHPERIVLGSGAAFSQVPSRGSLTSGGTHRAD